MMVTAHTARRSVRNNECVTCCTEPGRELALSENPARASAPAMRVRYTSASNVKKVGNAAGKVESRHRLPPSDADFTNRIMILAAGRR